LAELSGELRETVVPYGDDKTRKMLAGKLTEASTLAPEAAADRASFGAKDADGAPSRATTAEGDLLDDLADGDVKLTEIDKSKLPAELRKMSQEQLKTHLQKQRKERNELHKKIEELAKKRDAYIKKEQQRLAKEGKADSFDAKVEEMIRDQAKRKGMEFGTTEETSPDEGKAAKAAPAKAGSAD